MSETKALESMIGEEYKYGFSTDVEYEDFPKGLNEDIIRELSARKEEPEWMLEFRLKAYRAWTEMEEPDWFNAVYEKPDFENIQYYSAPKNKPKLDSLDDVDPKIKETYDKLGIPLEEQKQLAGVAVDAVFDSVSIFTSFKEKLAEAGVIFCSISEAIKKHPELVKKYMGSVVPARDNFYAALNSAVFSDGSFCYVPKDTICPMELSTYFRINQAGTGQFERTACFWLFRSLNQYFSREWLCRLPRKRSRFISVLCIDKERHSVGTNCSFLQETAGFRRFLGCLGLLWLLVIFFGIAWMSCIAAIL